MAIFNIWMSAQHTQDLLNQSHRDGKACKYVGSDSCRGVASCCGCNDAGWETGWQKTKGAGDKNFKFKEKIFKGKM